MPEFSSQCNWEDNYHSCSACWVAAVCCGTLKVYRTITRTITRTVTIWQINKLVSHLFASILKLVDALCKLIILIVEEPLTGVHLHRAVKMNDAIGTERILETGYVSHNHIYNSPKKTHMN